MIPKTHTLRLIVAGALLIVGPAGLPAEADGPSSANSTAQKAASSVAAVSPAGPTAAARGATAPSAAPKSGAEPLITNIFSETDLRQALMDIAAQAGIPIIPDATVQGTVSVDLKNAPLERALSMVLLGGGYAFAKQDGYYLVGSPEPDNPNFHLLTRTEIVDLKYVMPQTVIALLGCYRRYLSAESAPQQSPAPPPRSTSGVSVGRGSYGGGAAPQASAIATGPLAASPYRILVQAPAQTMERIRADIRLLDRAPHQLVIEASVIETTQDALGSLGVDWATKWLAGQHSDTSAPNLVYSTVARTQIAALTALVQTGRANLRANPRITTADGQTAEIEVGRDAYFAIVSGPAAYSYTTLEKIRASILLRITPRVLMPEREIIARIEPDIGDVTGKGMNGLPEITFRRALTSLRVRDGQSIVIGGLTNEVETRTVTKFPILGDIPLLGFAFRKQASRKTRTEVVIVITPRILYEGAE